MASKIKIILFVLLLTILPTLFIWLPFFLRIPNFWGIPLPQNGMATIVANYDGPLYLVVAKTLYNPQLVGNFSFILPAEYYAAHFPLFPVLIKSFAAFFGFPYSMLFVTLLTTAFAIYFFYLLVKDFYGEKRALWMSFVFSLFPARWLIVRSVGSAEPLFLACIIASVYFLRKEKYLLAGIFGFFAQLTKSPGILLFIAYFFTLFIPDFKRLATSTSEKVLNIGNFKKYLSILLIPVGLLIVFFIYKLQFNNFWAYFNSGDNIHLFFPPFQIFNYSAPWVGTFWLEEIILVYLLGLLGLSALIRKKEILLSWVVGIFLLSIFFVSHRDIIRYSLPIVPFLHIAFADTINRKEFRIIFLILIIPIYLFSLAYISQNVMPVSDWTPLL